MRIKCLLMMLTSSLLAAALLAAGCNKVREPQTPEQPGATGKTVDVKAPGSQAPSGPPPVIACDKSEFDFGTVSQGEEAVHTFTIKNTGKGDLKIERARGG